MTVNLVTEDGWRIFGGPVLGRKCGSCTLCCTVVPVTLSPIEQKPGNVRCRFQSHAKRCTIYAKRPAPCEAWSCKWLMDEAAAGLRRPDLGGYIVDPMLDTLVINGEPCDVVQVWVDPTRPDSHRAPELRAYLGEIAERIGVPAIARLPLDSSVVLLAPALTHAGWVERSGSNMDEAAFDRLVVKLRPDGRRYNHAIEEMR